MRRTAALMSAMLAALGTAAAVPDPWDSVLVVYYIDSTTEAQFSYSDGDLSAFWASWDQRDSALMVPDSNAIPGWDRFSDTDDASVVVKAAASSRGLYLYFRILDNVWVERVSEYPSQEHADDRLTFYVDTMSSSGIVACSSACVLLGALTHSTYGNCVDFCGAGVPSQCASSYYRDLLVLPSWSPVWHALGEPPSFWGDGPTGEPVLLPDSSKGIEWYIPWNNVGLQGTGVRDLRAGKGIAFTCDYLDRDSVGDPGAGMAWQGSPTPASVMDGLAAEPWGDLVLEEGFPRVAVKPKAAMVLGPSRWQMPTIRYFTVGGRAVGDRPETKDAGILIRHDVLTNGRTVARKTTVAAR